MLKKILYITILGLFVPILVMAVVVKVQRGDTLSQIAKKYNTSVEALVVFNNIDNPDIIYVGDELDIVDEGEQLLGGTRPNAPVAGSTYTLAGSGLTSSASSITLQKFTIPQTGYELQDSDLPDIFFITLEPGNRKRQEIASCTTVTQGAGTTATLSGCKRGLLPFYPYTPSSTFRFSHAGGTSVILSDAPQLFEQYVSLTGTSTISGVHKYSVYPEFVDGTTPTGTNQFATKGYVDGVGAGGFTASNIGKGTIAGGTSPETVEWNPASTSTGALGFAGDTAVIVLSNDNTLEFENSGLAVNTSTDYLWTGNNTHSATTTFATTTADEYRTKGGSVLKASFGGDGSDGALIISASATTTLDFNNANVLIKEYSSITIPATAGLDFSNASTTGSVAILKSSGDCTIGGRIELQGDGASVSTTAFQVADDIDHSGSVATGQVAGNGGLQYTNRFLYTTPEPQRLMSKSIMITAGSRGGDGASGGTGAAGTGGNGGGSLIIECAGSLTFTGVIDVRGVDGTVGTDGNAGAGGGGGGGSAGMALVLYNTLVSNTGTVLALGGSGGDGGTRQVGTSVGGVGGGGGAGGGCYDGSGGNGGSGGATDGNGVSGVSKTLGCGGGAGGGGGGDSGANSQRTGGTGGTSTDGTNLYAFVQNQYF